MGKEKDAESQLYYYGARYYSAWTCRFISTDPLARDYPQLTSFNYASNEPIGQLDIDGMQNPQESTGADQGSMVTQDEGTPLILKENMSGTGLQSWNSDLGQMYAPDLVLGQTTPPYTMETTPDGGQATILKDSNPIHAKSDTVTLKSGKEVLIVENSLIAFDYAGETYRAVFSTSTGMFGGYRSQSGSMLGYHKNSLPDLDVPLIDEKDTEGMTKASVVLLATPEPTPTSKVAAVAIGAMVVVGTAAVGNLKDYISLQRPIEAVGGYALPASIAVPLSINHADDLDDVVTSVPPDEIPNLFIKYVNEATMLRIASTGTIFADSKNRVFLTMNLRNPQQAHSELFIGETYGNWADKGKYMVIIGLNPSQLANTVPTPQDVMEFIHTGNIRIHKLYYIGPNPL